MGTSFYEKGTTEYLEFLSITRQFEELFDAYPNVKNLQQHPIKQWTEHILLEVLSDMANIGYALMLEKQLISLIEDLSSSRNVNLKTEINKLKSVLSYFLDKNVCKELRSAPKDYEIKIES